MVFTESVTLLSNTSERASLPLQEVLLKKRWVKGEGAVLMSERKSVCCV